MCVCVCVCVSFLSGAVRTACARPIPCCRARPPPPGSGAKAMDDFPFATVLLIRFQPWVPAFVKTYGLAALDTPLPQ